MSKIKVDEIESRYTNVKLASKGNGLVKVKGAGGYDGTLKLSSGTHGVKIKSPAHSAEQSYTLTLPDNNIEAGKFLKVKSVTGDVGQLEYDFTPADLTNLAANNITSGTLDIARFGSSLSATQAGLKFVSETLVGSTPVSEIVISGFEADKMYVLFGRKIKLTGAGSLQILPLDANGVAHQTTGHLYRTSLEHYSNRDKLAASPSMTTRWYSSGNHSRYGFIIDINNTVSQSSIIIRGVYCGINGRKLHIYGSMANNNQRIHKLKIYLNQTTNTFEQPTQLLLYEYLES